MVVTASEAERPMKLGAAMAVPTDRPPPLATLQISMARFHLMTLAACSAAVLGYGRFH